MFVTILAVEGALPGLPLQADPLVVSVAVGVLVVLGALTALRKVAFYRNFGVGSDSQPAGSKTNCPACGARVPTDREACDYCGESRLSDNDSRGR